MLMCFIPSVEIHAQTPARAESVVSPAWVKAVIDFHAPGSATPRPPGYRHNHYVILEASWAKPAEAKDYFAGHVPGALHLNTDELENGYPRWLLRKPQELQRVIGAFVAQVIARQPAQFVVNEGDHLVEVRHTYSLRSQPEPIYRKGVSAEHNCPTAGFAGEFGHFFEYGGKNYLLTLEFLLRYVAIFNDRFDAAKKEEL